MISVFGLRGLGLLVQFFPPFIVAKLVDHQVAGIFFSYQALAIFCSIVLKYGLDDYFLKNYADDNNGEVKNKYLLYITVAISVFVGIQILGSLLYKNVAFSPLSTTLAAISGSVLSLNSMVCAKFHGKLYYSRAILHANIIHSSLFVFFVVVFPKNELDELLTFYCLSLTLGLLFAILDNFFVAKIRTNRNFHTKYKHITIREIIPYAIGSIGPSYFPHGILYIAALQLSPTDITQLTLTLKLCHSALGVVAIINFYAAPLFAKLHSSGEIRILIKKYLDLTIASIVAGVIISALLYVVKYLEPMFLGLNLGSREFWWIWIGVMLNVSFGPIGYLSMMTGNQNINATAAIASVLISASILFMVGVNFHEFFILTVSASYAIPKILTSAMLYQKFITK